MVAIIIAVIAALAAIGSTLFAGMSLRLLSRQTMWLANQVSLQQAQTEILAEQNKMQVAQYEILAAATELQFNLDIMIRLQDVLLEVASDHDSYLKVWGRANDNRRPQMSADSILDVLSMALKACERLPHFASNESDWSSYVNYVMRQSSSLRSRVLLNREWWPEVVPFAERWTDRPDP